jgi:hypothetical protein
MTKTNEAKPVREARAAARRMAKTTDLSYQQALDRIARDGGHEHWAAFAASHPPVDAPTGMTPDETASTVPTPGKSAAARIPASGRIGRHMRSLVTGERGAELDRIRTAIVIEEAVEDQPWLATDERTRRRNLWISAAIKLVKMPAAITALGGLYVLFSFVPGGTDLRMSQVLHAATVVGAVSLATFLICLAIGDHPGMERRRALAWTAMKWAQAAGFCLFFLVGFPAFDQLAGRTLHLEMMDMVMLGTGAVMLGGPLRRTIHALMALGAALGTKGHGTSLANLDEIDRKAAQAAAEDRAQRPKTEPMTPDKAREYGAMRPWWKRIGLGEIAVGAVAMACLSSFLALGLQFVFHVDARPLAWMAMVVFGPLLAFMAIGMAVEFMADLLQIPGLERDLAYRRTRRRGSAQAE